MAEISFSVDDYPPAKERGEVDAGDLAEKFGVRSDTCEGSVDGLEPASPTFGVSPDETVEAALRPFLADVDGAGEDGVRAAARRSRSPAVSTGGFEVGASSRGARRPRRGTAERSVSRTRSTICADGGRRAGSQWPLRR